MPTRMFWLPRALISVFDKTGVAELAAALHDLGWELVSSFDREKGGNSKEVFFIFRRPKDA